MTPAQDTALQAYIDDCLKRLKMTEWRVNVDGRPSPKITDACIDIRDEYREADLRVCKEFFTYLPDEQRKVIAHELCHLLTARARAAWMTGERYLQDGNAVEVLRENFCAGEEYAVEQMSRLIYRKLRLPVLPSGT